MPRACETSTAEEEVGKLSDFFRYFLRIKA
jgi:hypothetical protein